MSVGLKRVILVIAFAYLEGVKLDIIPLQKSAQQVMSLECQVRIAAGFMVFSGSMLRDRD